VRRLAVRFQRPAFGQTRSRLISLIAITVLASGAHAQDPTPTPVVRHCISVARIKQTEVVNDRTILFHMLGGQILKNELPKRCAGLELDRGFAYAPSVDKLCNVDVIRVLGSGSVCPLGKFELYERPVKGTRPPLATTPDEQKGSAAE